VPKQNIAFQKPTCLWATKTVNGLILRQQSEWALNVDNSLPALCTLRKEQVGLANFPDHAPFDPS
jgi:hypothetical protein